MTFPTRILFFVVYYSASAEDPSWRRIPLHLNIVQPTIAHVFPGASVTFYCGSLTPVNWTFKHRSPDRIFQQSFERPLVTEQPVSRRHSVGYKNITLTNLFANDSGVYYCYGTDNIQSNKRDFFVLVWERVQYGLVIPSWIEVPVGSTVTLTCGSLMPVEWNYLHFDDQNKTMNTNNLTLYNLQKHHSGRYVCRGLKYLTVGGRYFGTKIFHNSAKIIVEGYVDRILR